MADLDAVESTRTRWPERLRRWAPMFAAAVIIRLAYWAFVIPDWKPDADADQYLRISRTIADGGGFSLVYPQLELHPTSFRPPLYPYLLTPGSWIFGEAIWPARLLSVALGSVVVVLAGVIATRIGGRLAGLVAAGAVTLYPPLLANDTITLTEPLALALLLATIVLVDDDRWCWAGLAAGLLLLTRPNGYAVVAILAVWCWRRLDLRRAAALGGVALLVLVPWLVRNQVQVGTRRLTTSDGFTLAAVYGLPGREAGHFVDPASSREYEDLEYRLARFDEPVWNGLLLNDGIAGIREDPYHVWYVVRRNFRGYFDLSPELNEYPERVDGRDMDLREDVRPVFFVVTILGLIGLTTRWRDPRVIVLVGLTAQFVVLSLLLVAPPRLRAPFDLICCIGVGLLVAAIAERREGPTANEAVSPSLHGQEADL
ncbi:MAG: glycosyltransferase family 39 protein [Actinomycetota bacterium]|nr:glycosyltransferase family 39 protein [Actinomycetota bacterium]